VCNVQNKSCGRLQKKKIFRLRLYIIIHFNLLKSKGTVKFNTIFFFFIKNTRYGMLLHFVVWQMGKKYFIIYCLLIDSVIHNLASTLHRRKWQSLRHHYQTNGNNKCTCRVCISSPDARLCNLPNSAEDKFFYVFFCLINMSSFDPIWHSGWSHQSSMFTLK
jgi:hypothetical protein